MEVYQLNNAFQGLSPMVWRRLKIADHTRLGNLYIIL
jgi:hypothetical protein